MQGRDSGCVQHTHFGLWTGSYIGRTGPSTACFRDFPVFARPGSWFESDLGHMFSHAGFGSRGMEVAWSACFFDYEVVGWDSVFEGHSLDVDARVVEEIDLVGICGFVGD